MKLYSITSSGICIQIEFILNTNRVLTTGSWISNVNIVLISYFYYCAELLKRFSIHMPVNDIKKYIRDIRQSIHTNI